MSLLDMPVVERRGRLVLPMGEWPEPPSAARSEAQRQRALSAPKRPKMTREQKLEARRLRRLELKREA